MNEEIEIWKDIPNYEGHYQVSSFGDVKSIARNTTKGGVLKKDKGTNGYLQVVLYKCGNRKRFTVHQLVAMAFLGHVPDGTSKIVVDHKDNNKLNNRADNLQLIPHRENASKDKKGFTSKFIGVSWDKNMNKWKSALRFNGRVIHLGHFELEIDAAKAYQKALKEYNDGLDLNILYPKGRNKSSKYYGVSWNKSRCKWEAKYKGKFIGLFNTEIEAHEAVQKYIAKLLAFVI
jgi:hypothetical protein